MKNKSSEDFDGFIPNTVDFCTECKDSLKDFGLEPKDVDLNVIRENFENCRRTGKFKGEMCSKIYILRMGEGEED